MLISLTAFEQRLRNGRLAGDLEEMDRREPIAVAAYVQASTGRAWEWATDVHFRAFESDLPKG